MRLIPLAAYPGTPCQEGLVVLGGVNGRLSNAQRSSSCRVTKGSLKAIMLFKSEKSFGQFAFSDLQYFIYDGAGVVEPTREGHVQGGSIIPNAVFIELSFSKVHWCFANFVHEGQVAAVAAGHRAVIAVKGVAVYLAQAIVHPLGCMALFLCLFISH